MTDPKELKYIQFSIKSISGKKYENKLKIVEGCPKKNLLLVEM